MKGFDDFKHPDYRFHVAEEAGVETITINFAQTAAEIEFSYVIVSRCSQAYNEDAKSDSIILMEHWWTLRKLYRQREAANAPKTSVAD